MSSEEYYREGNGALPGLPPLANQNLPAVPSRPLGASGPSENRPRSIIRDRDADPKSQRVYCGHLPLTSTDPNVRAAIEAHDHWFTHLLTKANRSNRFWWLLAHAPPTTLVARSSAIVACDGNGDPHPGSVDCICAAAAKDAAGLSDGVDAATHQLQLPMTTNHRDRAAKLCLRACHSQSRQASGQVEVP